MIESEEQNRTLPVGVKLHLRFHSCRWWGSCSRPTPNGGYYHWWFFNIGKQEWLWKYNDRTWVMFSPLTAHSSSSPTSIKSAPEQLWPPKNSPFPSENRTSLTYFSFLHFHKRITFREDSTFFSFSQFHWKFSPFPIIFNHSSRIPIFLTSPLDLLWKQLPSAECAKKSWKSVQNLASSKADAHNSF